jgi:hypothetical protein
MPEGRSRAPTDPRQSPSCQLLHVVGCGTRTEASGSTALRAPSRPRTRCLLPAHGLRKVSDPQPIQACTQASGRPRTVVRGRASQRHPLSRQRPPRPLELGGGSRLLAAPTGRMGRPTTPGHPFHPHGGPARSLEPPPRPQRSKSPAGWVRHHLQEPRDVLVAKAVTASGRGRARWRRP